MVRRTARRRVRSVGFGALLLLLVCTAGCSSAARRDSESAVLRSTSSCRSALPIPDPDTRRAVAASASSVRLRNGFGAGMFGIAAGSTLADESVATMRRDVADDARAGARWLRIDINWAEIQQDGPRTYLWGPIDRVLARASACGLHVLGTIDYSPAWARPRGSTPIVPPDLALFDTFAAAAARHLSREGMRDFEIWNEPNVTAFWSPRPSAALYTRMLRGSSAAIHRVDPHAFVISGGLSPAANAHGNIDAITFLQRMYKDGARGSFDAVGAHPYSWPAFPGQLRHWSGWYQTEHLRRVMVNHGDAQKQIWGTEFGAPTDGPAGTSFVSADTQAQMISAAYRLWGSYPWGGPLFVYQSRDRGSVADSTENFFGLLRVNFALKPAFTAYQRAALLTADVLADSRRR
jgi:hypothetical protein